MEIYHVMCLKVLVVRLTRAGNSKDIFRNLLHFSSLFSFVLKTIPNKVIKMYNISKLPFY